jgi:hypothetical protein
MAPESQSPQSSQKVEKKPYAEPRLRVYGDIRQVTQSSNDKQQQDNPGGNFNHSS